MSRSDQIDEIEQQLRQLKLSSQDVPIKCEHEKDLRTKMKDLQKKSFQQFECQQAERARLITSREKPH
jgi:hypothetical protein